jgi:hypothetical protein
VRTFGEVACSIRNQGPDDSFVLFCVRTDDELTVQITHVAGDDHLNQNPEAVAELVATAWEELA